MSGLVQPRRSASRPLTHLTSAAVRSAAPSRAPSASAVPPSGPVMNAGRTGYTISLAKSLNSETSERPLTGPGSADFRSGIEPHAPADQRHRQPAVAQDLAVEFFQAELAAAPVGEVVAEPAQLLAPQQRRAGGGRPAGDTAHVRQRGRRPARQAFRPT